MLTNSGSTGAKTDAAGDDIGESTAATRTVFTGNVVTTPVQTLADLAVSKVSKSNYPDRGLQRCLHDHHHQQRPDHRDRLAYHRYPAGRGVSYQSCAPPAGITCANSGQTVTCNTPTLANAASVVIPVTTTVAPGVSPSTLTDTATTAATTAEDVLTNNTAMAGTSITNSADVSLTKTARSPAPSTPCLWVPCRHR